MNQEQEHGGFPPTNEKVAAIGAGKEEEVPATAPAVPVSESAPAAEEPKS